MKPLTYGVFHVYRAASLGRCAAGEFTKDLLVAVGLGEPLVAWEPEHLPGSLVLHLDIVQVPCSTETWPHRKDGIINRHGSLLIC